jgi:hypothetical protein
MVKLLEDLSVDGIVCLTLPCPDWIHCSPCRQDFAGKGVIEFSGRTIE